jgi:transposase
VVHRRLLRPRRALRRGGSKKNAPGNAAEPADHALGRSRGGFGSKFHLLVDGNGLPLAVQVSPGQRHDSVLFESVMDAASVPQPLGRPRTRPEHLGGDKGYSYDRIRKWLRARRVGAVIPQRDDQRENHKGRPLKFDKDKYRRRSIVEQCIGWLKECRRVCTRYEKLALNFLAMLKLAIIQRYLKVGFSNSA